MSVNDYFDESDIEIQAHTMVAAFLVLDASLEEDTIYPIIRDYYERVMIKQEETEPSDFLNMVYRVKLSKHTKAVMQ